MDNLLKITRASKLGKANAALFLFVALCNFTIANEWKLEVKADKPMVYPNPAAVNEHVAFNFAVSLTTPEGKHVEAVVPSNIKKIIYSISCQDGKIYSTTPALSISSDKHSANNDPNTIQLYKKVSAIAKFSTVGTHFLQLTVTVQFKDNSQKQSACSLTVNIAVATLTIYAEPPLVRKEIRGFRHFYGDVGHSFWKISIDEQNLLPNENPLLIHSGVHIANHSIGFYPNEGMKRHLIDYIKPVDGKVLCDDNHAWTASKGYTISISRAINALAESNDAENDKYSVINIGGQNCTSQSSRVASAAGCNPPNGKGLVHYHAINLKPDDPKDPDNPNGIYGPGFPWRCPNPYVHAEQLAE